MLLRLQRHPARAAPLVHVLRVRRDGRHRRLVDGELLVLHVRHPITDAVVARLKCEKMNLLIIIETGDIAL